MFFNMDLLNIGASLWLDLFPKSDCENRHSSFSREPYVRLSIDKIVKNLV